MEDYHTLPADIEPAVKSVRIPWNKGKLVGAKPPLRPSQVWSIRTKLQIEGNKKDLAHRSWRPSVGGVPSLRQVPAWR